MEMKGSILFASFAIFLLQLVASPVQQQPPKARMEGVVVRLGSGAAVTGARVTLARFGRGAFPVSAAAPAVARGAAAPPNSIAPATTDDQGKFDFPELDEGVYTLQVLANGYVSLNYGQRYTGGPGTPISLKAGQDLKDLAVNLTPAGNISGRIRDRSDQPLANVPVQLLRYSYDPQGQRSYQSVGAAKTNDRGEYRIYWITPGRYYLMAGSPASSSPLLAMMTMLDGNTTNANEIPVTLGYAFYPGVADFGSAGVIDLQPGADLDSMNMTLSPKPPTFRIRGRVIDSRTGQPPSKARVIASARTPGLASNGILDQVGLSLPVNNYNSANGSFEIRDLLRGSYVVTAVAQDASAASAGARGGAGQPPTTANGMTTVAVVDSDIDGVNVTIVPAVAVTGRIRSDGQHQLPVTPDRMRLQLILRNPAATSLMALVASSGGNTLSGQSTPASDGTFRFATVSLGDYRVTLQSLGGPIPAGARPGSNAVYIKEARLDGEDVLNGPLRISGSGPGVLDIVVGVGGGQITGILNDVKSRPVPVSQVVLVPDRTRDRTELYRTVNTDENGRFTFNGIIPGDYKVFSWDGIEPFGWFDPEVMARSETKGVAVHVTDSSTDMIDVKLIPKEGEQ
jgi:hypothetical protein